MKWIVFSIPIFLSIPVFCQEVPIRFYESDPRKDSISHQALERYHLTNTSDLFFSFTLPRPLIEYQRKLLPGVPADSLFRKGNFQFCLLVDGRETYRSDLMPGAPQAAAQQQQTIWQRPLIDNRQGQGSWSESFWNRFLRSGGDAALPDGRHMLRMEIRAYVQTDTLLVSELIAAGELPMDVLRHPVIRPAEHSLSHPQPYPGFPLSKEHFDSLRIQTLKGNIAAGVFKKINGIVIIKKGALLLEEYFNGEDRNSLHDPRSVGKSFTSTIMGIAIQEGFIANEKQTLDGFYQLQQFDHFDSTKTKVTLADLLTMSSGFRGNDDVGDSPGNEENMYPTGDWVKFALDLPYDSSQRGQWQYFTAGVIVLGDILNKKVQGGLEKYGDAKLFRPLGITRYQWQYTPQQVPNTAGGIQLKAMDFAKYGQLYKNGGVWQGKRLLSRQWVETTFTRHRPLPGRPGEFYGYLFWNKTFRVNGKDHEAWYCAGNGGNYILVFKQLPLVIVITASAYGQPYAHPQVHRMLTEYLLPAVIY